MISIWIVNKKGGDAAFPLARKLLAAKINNGAGACQAVNDVITYVDTLLSSIGFDSKGNYLRPKNANYELAIRLAEQLDNYSNNMIPCPYYK